MRLATSGADPITLSQQAGALAGMENIERLGESMSTLSTVGQRAAYGRLTEQQQRALAQMGYAPQERDKGFLDGIPLAEQAWDLSTSVASTVMRPVASVVAPVVGPAFDMLTWIGDVPGHLYRAIRQMEGWQQWLALGVAAAAVIGTGGAALAGFAPAAAMLGGASTFGSLGVAGALGGIGLGAATLATVPTAIQNPTEWWDVMNPFGRTGVGRGERIFSRQGQQQAADILGGAEHLHAVARDLAVEMDLEDIAHEFGGVQNASSINVMMGSIERVAKSLADPGTPEYQRIYEGLATLVEQPEFVQAVDALQSSKISVGRDVAGAFNLQPGSKAYGLVSGATDAAWLMAMDPLLAVGKLGKLQQLARRGIKPSSGPEAIQILTRQINEDKAVGKVVDQVSAAIDTERISLMPKAWRSLFTDMLEYKAGYVEDGVTFNREEFLKYIEHGDGLRRIQEGKGTVRGVEQIVLSTINKDQGWGRFQESVRKFQHGLTDANLERELEKTAAKFGKQADLEKTLPSKVHDQALDMGFEVRDPADPLLETMSYKAGKAVGYGLVYAPIPGSRTVANVISGLSTMTPPGSGLALTGTEATENIPRFIESFGRHMNLPSHYRNEWLDTVMRQGTVGQRRAALMSYMDSGFTAAGMRSSDELSGILDKYLHKYQQAYTLGGDDMLKVANGDTIVRGILPEHHQAVYMQMPDLRELSAVIRKGHIAKNVGKITDSNFAEQAMSRVIKPGWLLRIGFIPRAAGEEFLSFWLRMSEGGLVQAMAGKRVANRELYYTAVDRMNNGVPYFKLEAAERAAVSKRLPGHLRPLESMGERVGWVSPDKNILNDYWDHRTAMMREGWFKGKMDLPDSTPDWLRTLAFGKEQSIRHLIVRGVDPDLVEAGHNWMTRNADTIMKSTSSMNASQFQKSIVNPDTTTQMVEDPNNPGQFMEEQVIPMTGERSRVGPGDRKYANAVHHKAGEWAHDEIISEHVANAWTSFMPEMDGILGKQNVVDALKALDGLDNWNQRLIMGEFLDPRTDNWEAAATMLDNRLPEHAAAMRHLARREEFNVHSLAAELEVQASARQARGPAVRQSQEDFEEEVAAIRRTARKLTETAPIIDGMAALSETEKAWLSAVLTRQMSSDNKAYDIAKVEKWANGELDSGPPKHVFYRGVPDDGTIRINPDGSLTLIPQEQTQWGASGRKAISMTTDESEAAYHSSRKHGFASNPQAQPLPTGAVIKINGDYMMSQMNVDYDEILASPLYKSRMNQDQTDGLFFLKDDPDAADLEMGIDFAARELALATPDEFTLPPGTWEISGADDMAEWHAIWNGNEVRAEDFKIGGHHFDELTEPTQNVLDEFVASLTEEERALLHDTFEEQIDEVAQWAEDRWGNLEDAAAGAFAPEPVLADVIYNDQIDDMMRMLRDGEHLLELSVYEKLDALLKTEVAEGVTAKEVLLAVSARDIDVASQYGTLDDIFREKLGTDRLFRQYDHLNQNHAFHQGKVRSSKALDLMRDGWGLRGTGGLENVAVNPGLSPFTESFDEMRQGLVNEIAAQLARPQNQQWVKQSDWLTSTADGRPVVQPPRDGLTRIYTPVVPPHSTRVDAILDAPDFRVAGLSGDDVTNLNELRTALRTDEDLRVDDLATILERGFTDEDLNRRLIDLGIDRLDDFPGEAAIPEAVRNEFIEIVEAYEKSDLDTAAKRLLDEAPRWAFTDPVIDALDDDEKVMLIRRALEDYSRGRIEYSATTSVPLHHLAFDDPRIAKWVSSLLGDTAEDAIRVGQLDVPRLALNDQGWGSSGVRLLNSNDRAGRSWDLASRYEAKARATDAPAFHHAPWAHDGQTGFDVVIGTSQEEALKDWAEHIVDQVLLSNRRGVTEAQVANERATALATREGDKFRPLAPGERMSNRTDLFEFDNEAGKVGKAVNAWGDSRYFEHELTGMDDNLMWSITGPQIRDFYEGKSGLGRKVSKDFRERTGRFGQTKKVNIDENLESDQLINMTRSRVEDVRKEPSAALPNVAIAQNYKPVYDTTWDKIVRHGFDKVIGPAIDAIVRKPMSFHYYAAAYKQNKQRLSWMLNNELFEKGVAVEFADTLANIRGEATMAAEYIDDARRVAKAEFGLDLDLVDDVDVQRWLVTLGKDRAEYREHLQGISEYHRSRAMGNASDELAVGLDESREVAWSAERLSVLNRDNMSISLPQPGVGGRTEAERFVSAYHEAVPDEVWNDGFEKVTAYLRQYVPDLQADFTPDQWRVLKNARNNLKHVIEVADETATLRAIENVIPFLDDHEQRSMFAEYGRNLLPFWYAEENFIKRWVRTLSLGQFATPFGFTVPTGGLDVMRRAQLTYMGIKSAGVIQTDANGEDWVVYPGSGLLQEAVEKIPGMGDKLPVGVMFRATTDSLLPGLTTESHVGGSPFVTVPVGTVLSLFPDAQNMKRALLGDIGANKGIIDQFVPSIASNAWTAFFGDEDSSVRYASAMNSAIAFMEAEGTGLRQGATPGEVDAYLDKVRNHARIIMTSQMLVGFVAPGAPSALTTGDDGILSFLDVDDPRQITSTMYREFIENMGIEEGTQAFLRTYPLADLEDVINPLAFTTSATESVSGAPLPATANGIGWYTDNRDWVDTLPEAGAWFIPQDDKDANFDYYSYSQQLASGLRKRKSPEELLTAIKYRQGADVYFRAKDIVDERLANVGDNREEAARINDTFAAWKSNFLNANPIFAEELLSTDSRIRRGRTILQIRQAVNDPESPDSPYKDAIGEISTAYDMFQATYMDVTKRTDARSRERARELKSGFADWAEGWVLRNPLLERLWTSVYRPEARID